MSSQNFSMKSYMRGALLLTIAALIVKILSAVYRVPFQNLVGDQGFYVYQQVYPFIAIFVTWTASGVAVAISKSLASIDIHSLEQLAIRKARLRVIFYFLSVTAIVFFSVLFLGAPLFAHWMADDGLIMPLRVGAFVTLAMPFIAILKGSFQSRGLMTPIAYAQVIEQSIRVAVIIIGTIVIMNTTKSIYGAGTMAILGTVVGEVSAVALLYYAMRKSDFVRGIPKVTVKKWPIIKEITLFSLSVSMSSLLLLGFQLVDSFTIFPLLLDTGVSYENAQQMKGIYDRGQPLVQLGLVIASSLALAIVPLITFKASNKSRRGATPFVNLTYRATTVFAVAAGFGLLFIMPFINQALFKTSAYSDVLSIYSLQIIPLALIITMTAILQGYSRLLVPSVYIICSMILKAIGNYLLIPSYELYGAVITSVCSLMLCAIFIIVYAKKQLRTSFAPVKFYIQLISATALMGIVIYIASMIIEGMFGNDISRMAALIYTLIYVSLGGFTFITVIAKLRVLKEKEWFLIPLGRRMAAYQLWLNRKK